MGRRLVVSDIHGEGARLLLALERAGYRPGRDRLFLLGDYIDRGADSRRTVEFIRKLADGGALVLRGNHDILPAMVSQDPSLTSWWIRNGGHTTIRDFGGLPPAEVIDWLETLPLYHEESDCILVHAGLAPGVPLDRQDPETLLWARDEFIRGYRGKKVIFGHTPTQLLHNKPEPWYGEDKVGIDTGAVWGGLLTVLELDSGEVWTA